ncbi:MAG: cobalamin-binding protein [Phycisphaeraceae bacterium]|nr:cobalamin-binding protein [Phycisphaeraceae bacterium]
MAELEQLTEAIKKGDRNTGNKLTGEMIEAGRAPDQILGALISGMEDVGRRFKANQMYVPEVLIAARAMKESMVLLEPLLIEAGIRPKYTAVIGTVEGDLHDIGKNLVSMMWKGSNIGVVDLGTNVPAAKFADAIREHNAQVVGLSALLTTTMPGMQQATETIREAGIDGVKIIVGGAPITQAFADKIGADAYAPDAASAVDVVKEILDT